MSTVLPFTGSPYFIKEAAVFFDVSGIQDPIAWEVCLVAHHQTSMSEANDCKKRFPINHDLPVLRACLELAVFLTGILIPVNIKKSRKISMSVVRAPTPGGAEIPLTFSMDAFAQ